jgi:hypothetical protein
MISESGSGAAAGKNPPTVNHALRAFLAFVCGVLIFPALVAAFNRLAGIEAPARHGMEKPGAVVWCLAVAMLLTGYVVARIAGRWGIPVSAALGFLLALGAGRAHLSWQGIESPRAQTVALLLLLPCALLSAWVGSRMARSEARKRAAETLALPLAIRQRAVVIWFAFLLGLGMTAAGVWVLRLGEVPRLGLVAVLFFGGATLLFAWRGITNRPHAILREEGVEFPAFQAMIPWTEIIEAAPHPLHPVAYVRFRIVDPQRYLARLSPLQTALTQTGEAEPNIGLPLTGTPYTVEQICDLVRSRARGAAR